MAKSQKRVATALVLVALLLLSVCMFSACGSKDYTVTFMIEGKSEVVSVVDGKVTPPEDPAKDGYIFRGWYTDETFTSPFDANAEIKENMTVYAYFVPVSANIHVNGEDKGEVQMKNYDAFTKEYQDDALSQNLTFDGWYIDAGYTTKYATQDVDDLYARYMAEVVFDNGYETVYTTLVQPDTVMKKPDTASVLKNYMDSEDLSYADSNGTAFDFTKTIDGNTTLTVLWKTPGLVYKKIEGTANYAAVGLDKDTMSAWEQYPCISILSENVTVGTDDNGNKVIGNVIAVYGKYVGMDSYDFSCTDSARQYMFGEGIEYITELQGSMNNVLEKIVFPESLKVLEKSVWNYDLLKSCNVPENIEVIIDCFWCHFGEGIVNVYRGKYDYDFEITIPAGVKTLSMVPPTVKFAQGSPYFSEGNRVYKTEGDDKILVTELQANVQNGSLTIPYGVTKIHVGVLDKVSCSYIYLPATFNGAAYTVDAGDYDAFYHDNQYLLTQHQYLTSPTSGKMSTEAYTILDNLEDLTYVIFDAKAYPNGASEYLFAGKTENQILPYTEFEGTKLVFVGEVTEGDIVLNIKYSNSMEDHNEKTVIITVPTKTSLERDALLEQLGITSEALGVNIKITSITQFGDDYVFGTKNCNQYIEIVYEYDVKGFTTSENADGTLTVTGFDQSTAQLLENGTYLIVIPDTLDGKAITAIANGAFKGVNAISKVYIGKNVKTIGAEAFMNTSNLEFLSVTPGGLEVIGKSAFENMGCVEENGKWVMNSVMPTFKFTNYTKQTAYIYIPLSNLKSIEPYAFKSMAIAYFMPVAGEENRIFMKFTYGEDPMYPNPVLNEFYYIVDASSDITGIIQYVGKDTVQMASTINSSETVDVTVWDVKYIASVSGVKSSDYLTFGWQVRPFAAYFGEAYDTNVLRYEVMEGSVYFREHIVFGIVSKVHQNACTDMGYDKADGTHDEATIGIYNRPGDNGWMEKDDVVNQSSDIFEDGWYEGIANSENTVTQEVSDYTSLMVS